MKPKLYYKIIFIISLLITTGCNEDFLTLDPTSQMTAESFYESTDDMYQALIGVYDVLQWPAYGDNCVELVSDILSDDSGSGGGSASDNQTLQVLDNYSYSPAICPDLWSKFYAGVYRANIVIEKMPDVEGESSVKDRMSAEAYFLRTYFYYQLWRFYGYIPLYTKNLVPSEYYSVQQVKPDDVYSFLIDQLDNNVIGKLPAKSELPATEYARITNAAAIALKARIVLYQNDESRMAEIASQLSSVIENDGYSLVVDFQSIWLQDGEFCNESVFEINFTETSQWGDWGNMKGTDGNYHVQVIGARSLVDPSGTFNSGWGFCPISRNLYNAYPANDQRRDATILDADALGWTYDNTAWQNTGLFSGKYAPRVGYNSTTGGVPVLNYNNNIRVIRYSDVLLMAAEAILRSNGSMTKAQSYFNLVVHRAYGPTYTETVSLNGIYRERRLEFAMEGIRYWDLVRTQNTTVLGALGWTTAKKYLPIPQTEIDNAQGALTQFAP